MLLSPAGTGRWKLDVTEICLRCRSGGPGMGDSGKVTETTVAETRDD
jgi:hypothetical protein